jgi:pimeloyl-ACP methyl ester carboxylesterase/DNA-binding winged helix-turn-helix (wHTH) protein
MLGVLLFGPFRLDLAARQLWQGDQPVSLPPKTLEILVYLAERAGQLVSREELFSALWPDTFVDDHALSVQIRDLRKALSEDAKHPHYIETRHRLGYCFKAAVTRVEAAHASASPLSLPFTPAPSVIRLNPDIPRTRYARSGDLNIAYQVLGAGPPDLVFVMGWVSHLEYFWTEPRFARFLQRLASVSRLILFDKRGTGLSDRVPVEQLPTLEQRMNDLLAVMDATGSRQAVICGISEGGCLSALFAATYPEKTRALVLIGTYAKRLWAPDYPWAPTPRERERFLKEIQDNWGGPIGIEARAPSLAHDPEFRQWWATYLRMGASPGAALALTRMNTEVDIRAVLPHIQVPSLVIHRSGDVCLRVEEGRYVASRIANAEFVELPGKDHLPFVGDQDEILTEIERFLARVEGQVETSGSLATVLVAGAADPHDTASVHDALAAQLHIFRASRASRAGPLLCAAFDGPARAIHCACAIRSQASIHSIDARIGLHTGECLVSHDTLRGAAVDVATRIQQLAAPGEILASGTVRDLVAGSGILFEPRGRLLEADAREWQLLKVSQS